MQQITQTTGDQKTTRAWINKYGHYNLNEVLRALLNYLASMCFWKPTGKNYKVRRNFQVSLPTLKKHMYCKSLNTAQKYIAEGVKLGFITVVKAEEGHRNAYALHVDRSEYYLGGTKAFNTSKEVLRDKEKAKKASKLAYEKIRRTEANLFAAEEAEEAMGLA